MTDGHGPHYGPWLALGVALPLTALVVVMARTWDHLTTFALIAAVTAVALQRARLAAALHWDSAMNRRQRDDARTRDVIEAVARPALTDSARVDLLTAQAEHVRAQVEAVRAPARRVPVSVNGQLIDDETGGWDVE